MSCNFGLKSYLWFQIELALRAHLILKSRVWFQTKLHSTQFNYHYLCVKINSGTKTTLKSNNFKTHENLYVYTKHKFNVLYVPHKREKKKISWIRLFFYRFKNNTATLRKYFNQKSAHRISALAGQIFPLNSGRKWRSLWQKLSSDSWYM